METISDKCLPPMPLTPLRTEVLLHPPPPGSKHTPSASVHAVAAVYWRTAPTSHKGPEDLSMRYVKEASHTPKTALAGGGGSDQKGSVWCLQQVSELFYSTDLSFKMSWFITARQTEERKAG